MILSIINIKKDKPSSIQCLEKINTYKNPVWLLIKCKANVSFWVKTNKITFSKNKNKGYINNLKAFCNNLTLCTKKKLTIFEPNTAIEQILIYDELPKKILKGYINRLEYLNKEFQKYINKNNIVIKELKMR